MKQALDSLKAIQSEFFMDSRWIKRKEINPSDIGLISSLKELQYINTTVIQNSELTELYQLPLHSFPFLLVPFHVHTCSSIVV